MDDLKIPFDSILKLYLGALCHKRVFITAAGLYLKIAMSYKEGDPESPSDQFYVRPMLPQ